MNRLTVIGPGRFCRALFIVLVGILVNGVAFAATSPYATTMIINGKVITADSDNINDISFHEAIAIRDGEIIAVGSNAELQKYKADWTEIIDAKGNSVLPGLIDTHTHLYEGTLQNFPWVFKSIPELLQVLLSASSPDEMLKVLESAVKARASQIPAGQWIQVELNPAQIAVQVIGHTLTKQWLDKVSPNHPVFVSTRGGAVYNTLGVKSIEARYRVPIPDDFWINESIGHSGDYTDGPRCVRGDIIVPAANRVHEYNKAYLEVLQLNAQTGVTTHSTHLHCEGGFNASVHLDRNDLMPIRLSWGHRWMQPFNPRVKETYWRVGDWLGYGSDTMWSNGSSAGALDGGGVAWCTTLPTKNPEHKKRELCPTMESSPSNMRRREHMETLVELAAVGRQTSIPGWHWSGDGSLDYLFNAIEKSGMPLEKIRSLRLQGDHCHTVRPDQIELASRYNMAFSCDSGLTPSEVLAEDYGEEYLTYTTPVASMLKAGVRTMISEFSSQGEIRHSPFEDGVDWLTREIDGKPFGVPEEAVPDRLTLLLMMTRTGGYALWKQDKIGSIEPGKWADIIILNGDYMGVEVEDLDTLKPIMTMVGERIVFEDRSLRGNMLYFNPESGEWDISQKTPTSIWRWKDGVPQVPRIQ